LGKGAKALATFLHIASDAEVHYTAAQDYFASAACEIGVSAFRGMLLVRGVATDAAALRQDFNGFLEIFRRQNLPRVFAA